MTSLQPQAQRTGNALSYQDVASSMRNRYPNLRHLLHLFDHRHNPATSYECRVTMIEFTHVEPSITSLDPPAVLRQHLAERGSERGHKRVYLMENLAPQQIEIF